MLYGLVEHVKEFRLLSTHDSANPISFVAPVSVPNAYSWLFPNALPASTKALTIDQNGTIGYQDLTAGGGGTVTSVALSLPNIFTVTGSPVTGAGTLTAALASQTANTFFAAPGGANGAPTFRSIGYADISALVGTGANSIAAGNDSRLHTQNTDTGTTQASFVINSGGGASAFQLKSDGAGVVALRNGGDTDTVDLIVRNLTVQGATTTISSEEINLADSILNLNSNYSGSTPTENAGFSVNRGTQTAAVLLWDESNDRFMAGLASAEKPIALYHEQTFTNASLVGGILTVTHNLGRRVVPVTIADNNNRRIGGADNVTYTSTSQCAIDLTSFGALTGTWTVVVG